VHFDDEVMRLFQTVGLAEIMQKLVHISPGMRFVDDAGRLLLDWSRPQAVGSQAWHASYRFHQPDLERVLREGLAQRPTVSVCLRTEVFAVEQEPDAIIVRYEDLATGRLSRCRARYVVGCDGARSLVRRLMDAPMEDLGFHERWLVVDAILKRPRPSIGKRNTVAKLPNAAGILHEAAQIHRIPWQRGRRRAARRTRATVRANATERFPARLIGTQT
jgi:3-(3-hydroxy-phenyl)propionate hydroxylase